MAKTAKVKDTKSAIIYARVSTADQATIPEQIEDCEEYARTKGYRLVHEAFAEERPGKKQGERVAYYDMLNYIEEHKPAHLLYFMSDRLTRNVEDFELLIKVCKDIRHNLILHKVSKPERSFGILDPEAFEELGQARKDAVDNWLFSARLRYRIIRKQNKMLRDGIYPGYAPVGYINNKLTNTIDVDRERAPLVVKAFNLMATGDFTIDELTKELRRLGLTIRVQRRREREIRQPRLVTSGDVWKLLKNTFYYGWFSWFGKLWSNRGINNKLKPTYKALISKTLYNEVQRVLERHRGKKVKRKKVKEDPEKAKRDQMILYRGMIKCRYCGCDLTAELKHGKYVYYRCTNGRRATDPDWYQRRFGQKNCIQGFWRQEKVTEAIDKALDYLSFDQETFDWLREQIGERMKEMEESGKVHLEALEARKEKLEEDKKQLFWALVKNIVKEDDPQYQSEKERIENELTQIQDEIDELKSQSSEDLDSGIETLEVAQSFVDFVKRKRESFDIKSKKADFKVLHSKLISNIIAGELREGESYYDEESFVHEGIEILYNEPFMTICDLNLQKKFDEWEKAEGEKYRLKRRKTTNGTPGGI